MKLVAATQNKHKLEEIYKIIKDFDMELVPMNEAGLGDLDIEETGTTLEENSLLKAQTVCDLTGCAAVADDTGLMVDALDGAPGVYSARYAGEHGNDAENRRLLLENMKDKTDRKAHFASVITLVYPDGRKLVAVGECHGVILTEERGDHGFGYDALFLPDGFDRSFAEISMEEKNSVSHRGRALRKLHDMLENDIIK